MNDKYMPFVMSMVIMCQVHHLSTEKDIENLQTLPLIRPTDPKQAYPVI